MTTDFASMHGILRCRRVIALAGVAISLVVACSSEKPAPAPAPSPPAIVEAAQATATPSPAPTETPSPSPTPSPNVVAATPASAAATGNGYFPPPPPRESAPPPNGVGIARVVAPDLGLDHYVEVDGIINNEMESPRDGSYAVGFYVDYDRPGTGGNSIFSAHETWNHFQGPFYQLKQAKAGDEVSVVMADGTQFHYRVVSNTRYEVSTIPMAEILWPSNRPAGEEWLTLLTCGGRIVYDSSGFGDYLDRDVVVAKRIS